ncbi:CAZyme family GH17 [Penicillium nucicola]|uniref:CAZyme family GH17 n=1 Tax=Penicillium nucicola TaxID=1850975 RepID=UPI0025458B36|nr:CAZyme family GH17 [Penicillium nucicola]KAJ5751504.1 CAZyme family GH17 [Penicillium nucicola]
MPRLRFGPADSVESIADLVGANIHPFFNADVAAANAGQFVSSQISRLEEICGNLKVVNLETGWPNAGDQNGAVVPGIMEQNTAVNATAEAAGSKSVFFSWINDPWKSPGNFDAEQHWGCADVFQENIEPD